MTGADRPHAQEMEPTSHPVPAPAPHDSAVTRFGDGVGPGLPAGAGRGLGMHHAIIAVSLVLIGAIWGAAAMQAQRERQSAIDTTNRQNSNLAIAFEEHTVRTLRGVDAAVLFIAHEFERSGTRVDIGKFVEDGLIDGSLFTNLVIVDERGNLVSSSQALRPLNIADRDHFKAHALERSGEFLIGKPVLSRTYGNWAIPMSRRITRPDGSFGGIVLALIDPNYFLRFYEKTDLGDHGVVLLVGRDGVVRARRAGNVATMGADMSQSALLNAMATAANGNFLSLGHIEGVPRYQSFRTLSLYPLAVAVGVSKEEVLAEFSRNRIHYYSAATIFSVIVALFSVLLIVVLRRQNRALEALSASETQFRATFEQAAIGIAHTAPSERFLRVNEKLCQMVGYTREELLTMTIHDLSHPDDRGRGRANRHRLIAGEISTIAIERRCVCKDGSVIWLNRTISMVREPTGEPAYFIRVMEDITGRKSLEHALQHLADHDRLTSLPNRGLIHDRLQHAVDQAARRNWIVGVMFIDLDRFKMVNDTLGHTMGDRLLQLVAARLRDCVRIDDTVGRLGGDEFAIILTELANVHDAELVAQKILDALGAPLDLDGREAFVSASIGIAIYPQDGASADTLIMNADAAMYRAKAQGKNNYQLYAATMNEQAGERLQMENSLRHAVDRGEFVLYFQPKANLRTGAIAGVEALLRWNRPSGELVPPAEFIPLLEESGLIVPVGEWVLRAACVQIRAWAADGVADVPIAVNLSARQFQQQDIAEVVRRALADYDVPPHLIELEITESAAMHNAEAASTALSMLKSLGVRIAIDDFGTGYSSLSYLKRFPIDCLKIDRSFIADITEDLEYASIAQAVITLAHALGLNVVAEGVENEQQAEFLTAHGCDEMQGYYFARPMPADECTQMLKRHLQPAARDDDHLTDTPPRLVA
jgi:diguanylate cyclase (GGDEF)-like protein/PAS domain S-box-containing protein